MEINKEQYLKAKNFRVFIPETLFPLPVKVSVEANRCPKCGLKLHTNLKKTLKWCDNRKVHAERFIITPKGFKKIQ